MSKNKQRNQKLTLISQGIITELAKKEFLPNSNIGLAVSGGPDSMVLLDIFRRLREKITTKLYVLHYNHKWRKDSNKDANLVENYCKKYNIPFVCKEEFSKVVKTEEEARKKRYEFFTDCARKYKLNFICTAHHKDDQFETVIFRLLRGTGPKGLLPIKELSEFSTNIKLFRPLLSFSKKDLLTYAHRYKIPYKEDKTNKLLAYKRNLIRLKLTPLFYKLNKQAINNVLLCSEISYIYAGLVETQFLRLLKKISYFPLVFQWKRDVFQKLDSSLQKAFIYWFFDRYNIEGSISKIHTVMDSIRDKTSLDLNEKIKLKINNECIFFENKKKVKVHEVKDKQELSFNLKNKKKKSLLLFGKKFFVQPFNGKRFSGVFPKDKSKAAYVDFSEFMSKRLTIRTRKPHDVFRPLGFPYIIKFKKYLINKKIPKEKRDRIPLLCYKNEVLWLPGYALSEKLKVQGKPSHLIKLVG